MATVEMRVNLVDLVTALAKVVDMMSPELARHHLSVAYIGYRLAEALEMPPETRVEVGVAGLLHDIGAFSLQERLDILEFEEHAPDEHARAGSLLLRGFMPLANAAQIIRFHHVPWHDGAGRVQNGEPVPMESHLLHLADRLAVRLPASSHILAQVRGAVAHLAAQQGTVFVPEMVEALQELARRDFVWLELVSGAAENILRKELAVRQYYLGLEQTRAFARLLSRIIDFKSEFTATHTRGLVAVAAALAHALGFRKDELDKIELAAYLHDLGKLAVPSEILEKPGKLDAGEWPVMRSHVYYTYQVLSEVEGLQEITGWSALHQERLDGSGYPFGYAGDELPQGARILAVADMFTGLTEDRPYRAGMPPEAAREVLENSVERGELDPGIVYVLLANFSRLNDVRAEAQKQAREEYRGFRAAIAGNDTAG